MPILSIYLGSLVVDPRAQAISELLQELQKSGPERLDKKDYKNAFLRIEPSYGWCAVIFNIGITAYVMDLQFVRVPEFGSKISVVMRGLVTSAGYKVEDADDRMRMGGTVFQAFKLAVKSEP